MSPTLCLDSWTASKQFYAQFLCTFLELNGKIYQYDQENTAREGRRVCVYQTPKVQSHNYDRIFLFLKSVMSALVALPQLSVSPFLLYIPLAYNDQVFSLFASPLTVCLFNTEPPSGMLVVSYQHAGSRYVCLSY